MAGQESEYAIDLDTLRKNGMLYVVPFVHDVAAGEGRTPRRVVTIYLKNYSQRNLAYRIVGEGAIDGQTGNLRGGEERFIESKYSVGSDGYVMGVLSLYVTLEDLDKLMANVISVKKAVETLECRIARGTVEEKMRKLYGDEWNAKAVTLSGEFPELDSAFARQSEDSEKDSDADIAKLRKKIRDDGESVVMWILDIEAQLLVDSYLIKEQYEEFPVHWVLEIIITVCIWFQVAKEYFGNVFL